MKLLTYKTSKDTSYGAVTGQGVIDLGRRLGSKYPDLKALIAGNEAQSVTGGSRGHRSSRACPVGWHDVTLAG